MERMISMFGIPEHIVERLKKEYPKGTRVELIEMNDPFRHIPAGSKGTRYWSGRHWHHSCFLGLR